VKKISKIYETKPIVKTNVGNYFNAVIEIYSDFSPLDIKFKILRKIEEDMGRVRTEDKFKSRVIDLDLIIYGEDIFEDDNFILPDPEIEKYIHIAKPLSDIAFNIIHPKLGISYGEIMKNLSSETLLNNFTIKDL
jgi:2-amino-4-hydroxy-6-hydroxymethyldihydropteridine diphosphokinase|tara:strand:+ start:2262 stop:2666 length:405 start_codon:yes stop_codon:yes gene_type:complete